MPPARAFGNLGLFVRPHFLSPDECRRLAVHMLADQGEPAGVFGSSSGGGVDLEVRRAFEVDVPSEHAALVEKRLRDLRAELEAHFTLRLESPESSSYVRYPAGAFYRAHRDRRVTTDSSRAEQRAVSVVIFVNGPGDGPGFAGGNLRFYGLLGDGPLADLGIDAEPEAGTLIAFRSTTEHEVTTVERGVRCSVVAWFSDARS